MEPKPRLPAAGKPTGHPRHFLSPPVPEVHAYRMIIDDVIKHSREFFLEEGVDESVLMNLGYMWEARLESVFNPEAAAAAAALQAQNAASAAQIPQHDQLGGYPNDVAAVGSSPASGGISLLAVQSMKSDHGGGPPAKRQHLGEEKEKEKADKSDDGLEHDEDELGSDLDEPEDKAPETDNLVLCQYEKVTRTKTKTGNRFKCVLKDGIMSLQGREILFHKGTGEAED